MVRNKQQDYPSIVNAQMASPFVVSTSIHIIFMAFLIIGLPFFKPELPPLEQAITIEFADIDEITQSNEPEIIPQKPRPKPEKENDEPPKQDDKPKPAPTVTAPAPPKPSAPVEPDLAVPDNTAVQKAAPAPSKKPKPPALEKPEEQTQQEFDSVLKNLLPNESEPEQSQPVAPQGERLTITQRRLLEAKISRQIGACWNLMAGARYAENLVVKIRLYMARDGMVQRAEVTDQLRYNADSFFRAAADSALRAVKSPSCTPFDLPLEHYEHWKIIDTTFDPREMLL